MTRDDREHPSDVRCRLATLADVPELARMRWAFRAESGEVPRADEREFAARYAAFVHDGLASGDWAWWVAVDDDGRLVAHMAVCVVHGVPRPARACDQWGYLTDCYTRPAQRGRGVGGALLAHVRAWAAARDLELLVVWPSEASEGFYARAGFAPADDVRRLALRAYDAPPGTS
jgi:GNAT superfamily N-acetyltransferase